MRLLLLILMLLATPAQAFHSGVLQGPFSDEHTERMQKPFDLERERYIAQSRIVWYYWPTVPPSDDVLETAYHISRASFCCITQAQRDASRQWLAARGRSHVCFDVIAATMYQPTNGRCD